MQDFEAGTARSRAAEPLLPTLETRRAMDRAYPAPMGAPRPPQSGMPVRPAAPVPIGPGTDYSTGHPRRVTFTPAPTPPVPARDTVRPFTLADALADRFDPIAAAERSRSEDVTADYREHPWLLPSLTLRESGTQLGRGVEDLGTLAAKGLTRALLPESEVRERMEGDLNEETARRQAQAAGSTLGGQAMRTQGPFLAALAALGPFARAGGAAAASRLASPLARAAVRAAVPAVELGAAGGTTAGAMGGTPEQVARAALEQGAFGAGLGVAGEAWNSIVGRARGFHGAYGEGDPLHHAAADDAYAALGLDPRTATPEAATRARNDLARRWHPDLHPDDPAAPSRMQAINAAHDVVQADLERRGVRRGSAAPAAAAPPAAATQAGQRPEARPASGEPAGLASPTDATPPPPEPRPAWEREIERVAGTEEPAARGTQPEVVPPKPAAAPAYSPENPFVQPAEPPAAVASAQPPKPPAPPRPMPPEAPGLEARPVEGHPAPWTPPARPVGEAKSPTSDAHHDADGNVVPGSEVTPEMIERRGTPRGAPVAGALPHPSSIVRMATGAIKSDPTRFQFKQSLGPEGVSPELKRVQRWNPALAGVVSVWRDPANGGTYVVNGHHRLELARRLNVPSVNVQYLDAPNAEAARAEGAFINIAEGRGSKTDVAKFLRDNHATPAELEARGVSLRGDLARGGMALSSLAPDIFDQVATGKLNEGTGEAIGEQIPGDPELQRQALAIVRGAKGKRLTTAEVREVAAQVKAMGTEDVQQEDIFGTRTERQSIVVERGQLAASIRDRLGKEKRLFGFVAKGDRASQLGQAGSTHIDVGAAADRAERAAQLEEGLTRLYTRSGPIADALTEGARRIKRGEKIGKVAAELYPLVLEAVSGEVGRAGGGAEPHVPERGVPAEAGTSAAGGAEEVPEVVGPTEAELEQQGQDRLFERPQVPYTSQSALARTKGGVVASAAVRSLSDEDIGRLRKDLDAEYTELRAADRKGPYDADRDARIRRLMADRARVGDEQLSRGLIDAYDQAAAHGLDIRRPTGPSGFLRDIDLGLLPDHDLSWMRTNAAAAGMPGDVPVLEREMKRRGLAGSDEGGRVSEYPSAPFARVPVKALFDTKVTLPSGWPMVVYRGEVSATRPGEFTFFTPNPEYASFWARKAEGSRVTPAFLNITNPAELTDPAVIKKLEAHLEKVSGEPYIGHPVQEDQINEYLWAARDLGYDGAHFLDYATKPDEATGKAFSNEHVWVPFSVAQEIPKFSPGTPGTIVGEKSRAPYRGEAVAQEDFFGKPELIGPEQRELLPDEPKPTGAAEAKRQVEQPLRGAEEIARARGTTGEEPPGERPLSMFERGQTPGGDISPETRKSLAATFADPKYATADANDIRARFKAAGYDFDELASEYGDNPDVWDEVRDEARETAAGVSDRARGSGTRLKPQPSTLEGRRWKWGQEENLREAEKKIIPAPTKQQIELVFGSEDAHRQAADLAARANKVPTYNERRAAVPIQQGQTWVDVRGKVVKDAADIWELHAPFRSPLTENLQFVLAAGDELKARTVDTSGALTYVQVDMGSGRTRPGLPDESRKMAELAHRAERAGADEVFTIHHHPSGNPTPSSDDIEVHRALAAQLEKPRFGRPLRVTGYVTNKNTIFRITTLKDASGQWQTKVEKVDLAPTGERDWTDQGPKVRTKSDMENVVGGLGHIDEEGLHVLHFGADARAIALVPHKITAAATIGTWLDEESRALGSANAIIVLPKVASAVFTALTRLRHPLVFDIVTQAPTGEGYVTAQDHGYQAGPAPASAIKRARRIGEETTPPGSVPAGPDERDAALREEADLDESGQAQPKLTGLEGGYGQQPPKPPRRPPPPAEAGGQHELPGDRPRGEELPPRAADQVALVESLKDPDAPPLTPEQIDLLNKVGTAGVADDINIDELVLPSEAPKGQSVRQWAARALNSFVQALNPEWSGPEARATADVIRRRRGEMMRAYAILKGRMAEVDLEVSKLSKRDQLKVMTTMERGQPSGLPKLDRPEALPTLRRMKETVVQAVIRRDLLRAEQLIENHVAHRWQVDPDVLSSLDAIHGKRPFAGPQNFRKARTFPLMIDGIQAVNAAQARIDAGKPEPGDARMAALRPLSYNPVRLDMMGIEEMLRAIAAHDEIQDELLAQRAKWVKIGDDPPVDAQGQPWVRVDKEGRDPSFVQYGTSLTDKDEPVPMYGAKGIGAKPVKRTPIANLYAPRHSAAVWHGALSKGMRGHPWLGPAYEAYMAGKSATTQLVLSWSGFHGINIAYQAIVSNTELALADAFDREGSKALHQAARAPTAPVADMVLGLKVIAQYLDPAAHPELEPALRLAVRGGFQATPNNEWYSGDRMDRMREAWSTAWNKDNPTGQRAWAGVKLAPDALFALIEAPTRLLMGKYALPLKAAAVWRAAAAELAKMPPEADRATVDRKMSELNKEFDYRYGMVVRDNYFMPRMLADIAEMAFLAPRWTAGSAVLGIRGAGQAPYRLTRRILGKGKPDEEVVGRTTRYAWASFIVTAMAGGIITYLLTGEKPHGKDFLFPRDGTNDEDGNPNRISLPGYPSRDWYDWTHHPGRTLFNKQAAFGASIVRLAENRDYFGNMYWNPDHPDIGGVAKGVASEFAPISARNIMEQRRRAPDSSPLMALPSLLGSSPVHKDIQRDAAQNLMADYLARRGHTALTPEQQEASRARADTIRMLRGGNDMEASRDVERRGAESHLADLFKGLSLTEAEAVYQAAVDEDSSATRDRELDTWEPIIEQKRSNAERHTTGGSRRTLRRRGR